MLNGISVLDELALGALYGGTQGSGGSSPNPIPPDPPPDGCAA